MDHLLIDETAQTGHTIIQVSSSGENAILYAPGANEQLTKRDIV